MKKRWHEIDALYCIGIILVLVGHSHSSDWSTFRGTILEKAIQFIYTFHMPLFYFISGFLFENSASLDRRGYGTWLADKAVRLLTPYLFWSLIAAVPKYWVENRTFVGVGGTILDVFINPRASVWGHFWFIPVLFLCYVIFGALKGVMIGKMMVYVSVVFTAVIYFLPIKTPILGLADLHTYMFFFAVGIAANTIIRETNVNIPRCGGVLWIAVVIAGCVLLTPMAYKRPVVGMMVALLMISACWVAATMIRNKVVDWISNHNFTMYIFSWFFQSVMIAICGKLGLGWVSTFFIMFTVGAIGPAIVVLIYEKFPFLHKRGVQLVLGMRG